MANRNRNGTAGSAFDVPSTTLRVIMEKQHQNTMVTKQARGKSCPLVQLRECRGGRGQGGGSTSRYSRLSAKFRISADSIAHALNNATEQRSRKQTKKDVWKVVST